MTPRRRRKAQISEADGRLLDKPKLRTEGVGDPLEGLLGGCVEPRSIRLMSAWSMPVRSANCAW